MDDDVESTGSDHSTQDQELPGYKSDRRFRKSLSVLTDRFVALMKENGGTVDLKTAHIKLKVKQRRRIYDIVNVMEGIGLVKKVNKYNIIWQ